MLRVLFYVFSINLFVSCSVVKVSHTSQLTKLNKNYWVYALPKTEIQIDVIVEKQIFIKGPFAEYATKYLGISNVSTKNYEQYSIKDIRLNTSLLADSEQIFVVQYNKHLPWQSITQTNDGIIIGLNTPENETNTTYLQRKSFIEHHKPINALLYTEVSKSPFIKEKIDTVFKQVRIDTVWVRVPTQRKSVDTLKAEEKAKEAAKIIFELRTRMFDLFTGELDVLPQEESAKFIAEELRTQEQEYLELFIGKTFKTYETYSYKIVPTTNENNLYVLSFFSESKGMSDSPQKGAEPIMLQIKSLQTFTPLTYQILKLKKAKKINAFYVKYPNKALVKIMHDNEILIEQDIWYYQSGKILKLPVSFLKKGSYYFNENQIFFKKI